MFACFFQKMRFFDNCLHFVDKKIHYCIMTIMPYSNIHTFI